MWNIISTVSLFWGFLFAQWAIAESTQSLQLSMISADKIQAIITSDEVIPATKTEHVESLSDDQTIVKWSKYTTTKYTADISDDQKYQVSVAEFKSKIAEKLSIQLLGYNMWLEKKDSAVNIVFKYDHPAISSRPMYGGSTKIIINSTWSEKTGVAVEYKIHF
jgi:hypothetical protein